MDFKCFIAVGFFSILTSFVSHTAGNQAIVGGEKAAVDQFPYQVSVQKNTGVLMCGGAVIGEKFILTAAHCFLDEAGQFEDKNYISVLAGTNDFKKTGKPAEVIKVQKIYVPTKFVNYTGDRRRQDIAVLRLEHPLKLTEDIVKKSKHIRKVHLPKHKHEVYDGKTAMIAGFGWDWVKKNGTDEDGGWTDTILRYAQTDIVNMERCAVAYNVPHMPEPFLCARIQHRHPSKIYGTCYGDSGSPLVYDNTVIGVLIVAPLCFTEKIQPSVYVGVAHFLDFIAAAMKDKKSDEIHVHDVRH